MVRIQIKLKSLNTCSQKVFEKKYRSAFKAYIYNLLSDSKYQLNRENSNFRGFCFSNVFPIEDGTIKEGQNYFLTISSPLNKMILVLRKGLNEGDIMNLGEGSFEINSIDVYNNKLFEDFSKIESINPILITSKDTKDIYVDYEKEKDSYIDILRRNLIKKYNNIKQEDLSLDYDLFDNIEIKDKKDSKRNSSHYALLIEDLDENRKGEPIYVYGNKLIFNIKGELSDKQKEILNYVSEAGFGIKSSYGFGYMRGVE